MLNTLTDEKSGAITINTIDKDGLRKSLAKAPARERAWLKTLGFTAEPGKFVFLPGSDGRPNKVVVGANLERDPLWALAGLPDSLPEGRYRLDARLDRERATKVALGWALGAYAFTRYKTPKRGFATLVWPGQADRQEVERLARGVFLARDLINTPAEDLGPPELAAAASKVAKQYDARCTVISGGDLLKKNYPTIHAVGRASSRPPCLIDLRWGRKNAPKVTLVGKGVCFDTGGLDLKPAANMLQMKKDMGGAAVVLGLASALMSAKAPIRLRVLIPAVENSVSANAIRPLDIVRTRSGKTVEIGNTDAEGRLILCDALAEADSEKPEPADRLRDLDRRRARRARPRGAGAVLQRRRAGGRDPARKRRRRRSDLAPADLEAVSQADRQQDCRLQQRRRRSVRRLDHRRALSGGIRARVDAMGASRHHGVEHPGAARPPGGR